jgi:ABC-type transporter Mla maintaining outer membrane lipid asymmetry permease subunit MlaE
MSKLKQATAVILLALNAALTVFLWWSQITIAEEGRRYGLDEHPPIVSLLFITAMVAACAYALFTRRYGAAVVGGAILAFFLVFPSLMILGGVGM